MVIGRLKEGYDIKSWEIGEIFVVLNGFKHSFFHCYPHKKDGRLWWVHKSAGSYAEEISQQHLEKQQVHIPQDPDTIHVSSGFCGNLRLSSGKMYHHHCSWILMLKTYLRPHFIQLNLREKEHPLQNTEPCLESFICHCSLSVNKQVTKLILKQAHLLFIWFNCQALSQNP